MKVTLRAPIVLSFGSVRAAFAARTALALIRATLVSAFTLTALFPLERFGALEGPLLFVSRVLEFPIYLVGLLIPSLRWAESQWAPHPYLGMGAIDPVATFWLHMRTGVLTYFVIFMVPSVLRVLRDRRRGTKQRNETSNRV